MQGTTENRPQNGGAGGKPSKAMTAEEFERLVQQEKTTTRISLSNSRRNANPDDGYNSDASIDRALGSPAAFFDYVANGPTQQNRLSIAPQFQPQPQTSNSQRKQQKREQREQQRTEQREQREQRDQRDQREQREQREVRDPRDPRDPQYGGMMGGPEEGPQQQQQMQGRGHPQQQQQQQQQAQQQQQRMSVAPGGPGAPRVFPGALPPRTHPMRQSMGPQGPYIAGPEEKMYQEQPQPQQRQQQQPQMVVPPQQQNPQRMQQERAPQQQQPPLGSDIKFTGPPIQHAPPAERSGPPFSSSKKSTPVEPAGQTSSTGSASGSFPEQKDKKKKKGGFFGFGKKKKNNKDEDKQQQNGVAPTHIRDPPARGGGGQDSWDQGGSYERTNVFHGAQQGRTGDDLLSIPSHISNKEVRRSIIIAEDEGRFGAPLIDVNAISQRPRRPESLLKDQNQNGGQYQQHHHQHHHQQHHIAQPQSQTRASPPSGQGSRGASPQQGGHPDNRGQPPAGPVQHSQGRWQRDEKGGLIWVTEPMTPVTLAAGQSPQLQHKGSNSQLQNAATGPTRTSSINGAYRMSQVPPGAMGQAMSLNTSDMQKDPNARPQSQSQQAQRPISTANPQTWPAYQQPTPQDRTSHLLVVPNPERDYIPGDGSDWSSSSSDGHHDDYDLNSTDGYDDPYNNDADHEDNYDELDDETLHNTELNAVTNYGMHQPLPLPGSHPAVRAARKKQGVGVEFSTVMEECLGAVEDSDGEKEYGETRREMVPLRDRTGLASDLDEEDEDEDDEDEDEEEETAGERAALPVASRGSSLQYGKDAREDANEGRSVSPNNANQQDARMHISAPRDADISPAKLMLSPPMEYIIPPMSLPSPEIFPPAAPMPLTPPPPPPTAAPAPPTPAASSSKTVIFGTAAASGERSVAETVQWDHEVVGHTAEIVSVAPAAELPPQHPALHLASPGSPPTTPPPSALPPTPTPNGAYELEIIKPVHSTSTGTDTNLDLDPLPPRIPAASSAPPQQQLPPIPSSIHQQQQQQHIDRTTSPAHTKPAPTKPTPTPTTTSAGAPQTALPPTPRRKKVRHVQIQTRAPPTTTTATQTSPSEELTTENRDLLAEVVRLRSLVHGLTTERERERETREVERGRYEALSEGAVRKIRELVREVEEYKVECEALKGVIEGFEMHQQEWEGVSSAAAVDGSAMDFR
ncbi:uncharacterized protein EV422DRAFT_569576 [Fimicolochytrium jonesii]|uniref:uncharacterized protein n=1 Tax=Fimicolochytrium jonesii TaxID=1396493 RepID=UPI0022FF2C87|nr:uncharacterized protein EV422DRAFT_569576 [Fimicolochytrium jonesii]KAI8818524.1 hypothetical protein EV422DRAFT_569576 [Fimicolochytrium jonesii]